MSMPGVDGPVGRSDEVVDTRSSRARIAAWASFDWGSAAFNTVIVMFIFTPYLTGRVGAGMPDGVPQGLLGWMMGLGGVLVFVLAPVTGVWADTPQRRRTALALLTTLVVLVATSMSLVREDNRYLWLGLGLYCAGSVFNELAQVPYNAMLHSLTTPANASRVSGLGLAAAYIGGVVVLLVCYVCFIAGDGSTRGLFEIPAADGFDVRVSVVLAAAWFAVFALPLVLARPVVDPGDPPPSSPGLLGVYRELWRDLVEQWHQDRRIIYFLGASAIFRDGLVAMFALTPVIANAVFHLSGADITLFGVAANVMAAFGAVLGGLIDTRVGSKRIIIGSLAAIVTLGSVMTCLSGQTAFWICGLAIAVFVGPPQSAARTLVLRMAPAGRESFVFGLYTMTGRAVSFVGPWLFATFALVFHATRAGIAGLVLMIGLGMVALMFVKVPRYDPVTGEIVSGAS
ncbi:MFS transporter [Mycobacterium sp. CBMA271]|nr:MFS transporter [Mycobacteroides sp. CBMA 271]